MLAMTRDQIATRIREVVERRPEVVVAYLFGSVARGTAGPLSDVDVAVLLRGEVDPFEVRLALLAELAEALASDDVDLVVLNQAPISLAYRVLRDGRPLVSKDEGARVRHRVEVVDRYLDMEPFRRVQAEALSHRLQETRFGRS